jgi:rubrerythrin
MTERSKRDGDRTIAELFCNLVDDARDFEEKNGKSVLEWIDENEDELRELFRGEACENVKTDGYGFRFVCSECGYSTIVHNCAVRLDELPRFCPSCGREVVSGDD